MSKAGEIPYSWDQIEDQIRLAISAQASILETFGPECERTIVETYLGISEDQHSDKDVEDITDFDINRHHLYTHVKRAYTYAYQLEGAHEVCAYPELWHDTAGLLEGFPQTNANGEPSPLCERNDFPLRRMLGTFVARWGLYEEDQGLDVSIRELSLLSNMTVPAVRTSLSKEGFKLEKTTILRKDGHEETLHKLSVNDALVWLSRRRGFIQQLPKLGEDKAAVVAGILSSPDIDFLSALNRIFALSYKTNEELAQQHGLDHAWLQALRDGKAVEVNLDALRATAKALFAPEPDFVSLAVKHLLTQESQSN